MGSQNNTSSETAPRRLPVARNSKRRGSSALVARDRPGLDVDGSSVHRDNQVSEAGSAAELVAVAQHLQQEMTSIGEHLDRLLEILSRRLPQAESGGSFPAAEDNELLAKHVCVRIRHARTSANLTQQALADLIGVDRIQMVHWEAGRNRPSVRYRMLIAEKTGFPPPFFNHDAAHGPR
jgi:DNA-binding XRE family transcriptional regulator